MCNQTAGLVQAALEKKGIACVSISLLKAISEKVGTRNCLSLPFKHGYPLGGANQPELQRKILDLMLKTAVDAQKNPQGIINIEDLPSIC